MSLLTNWGYTLKELNALESLISVSEFNAKTANKYSADTRLSSALASASQIVRDYAGWHLYPSAACEIETAFYDNSITLVKNDVLIQLPARYVSAVSSITIDDEAYTSYFLETNGLLRVIGAASTGIHPYSIITVDYTAGLPDAFAGALKEIVTNKTIKGLNSSNGVQSETAGGVSISYSSQWITEAAGPALSSLERASLRPYILQGVF